MNDRMRNLLFERAIEQVAGRRWVMELVYFAFG